MSNKWQLAKRQEALCRMLVLFFINTFYTKCGISRSDYKTVAMSVIAHHIGGFYWAPIYILPHTP